MEVLYVISLKFNNFSIIGIKRINDQLNKDCIYYFKM